MSKKSEIIMLVAEASGRNLSSIDEKHHLKKDLQMDETDWDDLIQKVEKFYNISFPQADLDKIHNVKTLIAYTDYHLAIQR